MYNHEYPIVQAVWLGRFVCAGPRPNFALQLVIQGNAITAGQAEVRLELINQWQHNARKYMNIAGYYNTQYKDIAFTADQGRVDRLKFILSDIPRDKKVVSLGCGPGVDLRFLVAQGNEVHGVDVSEAALQKASEIGLITHRADLSDSLSDLFNDSSFDVVVATDIFEHLFIPRNLLKEIARILRPEGVLIASVPNHFFLRMRLRILFGHDIILPYHTGTSQEDYFHMRFFTSAGFERFICSEGFEIRQKSYDQFVTPHQIPLRIAKPLARKFPDLFSLHFIVKAGKQSNT